jgi:sulfonate transport system substrate-binding protein
MPLLRAAVALMVLLSCGLAHAASGDVLKVGDQKGGIHALLDAAQALDDVPYRIEWDNFAAAAPLLEAMNAGAVDTGLVGDAPFIFAAAARAPIKAIVALRSGPAGTAIIAPANSPIRSPADLRGKTIATVKGSVGHYLALRALDQARLKVSDVRLVFLGNAEAKAALASGTIDAWSTWDPYTALAEIQDGARTVVGGAGLMTGLGFQAATDAAIADKPALLADFIRRLDRAYAWALVHPNQWSATWAAETGLPPDVARVALDRRKARAEPIDAEIIAAEQQAANVYADHGVIPSGIDIAKSFDSRFNQTATQ